MFILKLRSGIKENAVAAQGEHVAYAPVAEAFSDAYGIEPNRPDVKLWNSGPNPGG